jgi:hypothetical protein
VWHGCLSSVCASVTDTEVKIPLRTYLQAGGGEGGPAKVYSLVAAIPFSPIDMELNLLAKGGWDALCDRFRIWYLPRVEGNDDDKPICYVMVRKFDKQQEVLACAHIVMNLEASATEGEPESNFTVGILSNDEAGAGSILEVMLGVPPIFHTLSEITLIENRWRTDPESVMRFAANVYAATSGMGSAGEISYLNLRLPSDFLAKIKPGLDVWWDSSSSGSGGGKNQPSGQAES